MSYFTNPLKTPWGYTVDAETLPDILTYVEFNNFTAGKFGADARIQPSIPAASEAIRNYCGWHISPELRCGMLYNVHNLRDAFVGSDLLIQLPATFVTGVSLVVLNAIWDETEHVWKGDQLLAGDPDLELDESTGLLRVFDASCVDRRSKIFVDYTAGYPEGTAHAIKDIASNLVTHAVANPYGVASESAGGVSVSYSAAWAGTVGASQLSEPCREMLAPYKVKGVF